MAQNLEHIIWGLSQICNLKRGLQVCHIRLIFSEIYIKDGIKNKILLKIIVSISKTFKTSIFDLASSTRIVSHDGKIFKTKTFFFLFICEFYLTFFLSIPFLFLIWVERRSWDLLIDTTCKIHTFPFLFLTLIFHIIRVQGTKIINHPS